MLKSKQIRTGKIFYSDIIPELNHFFTTRETVIRNADGIDLTDNIDAICEYLNITKENLISPSQTHTSHVEFAEINKNTYPDTDSLILTNKVQAIYLNFADCTPVILYDKAHNIGGIAHAGWRGTVKRIVPKTVSKMLEYTSSKNLNDIYAVIGPSIGICCYNVGDDVINGVKDSVKDFSKLFRYENDNTYVDLKQTNAQQLIEMGVPLKNIDISTYCTSCNNDLFFSYRKENGTTFRHSAVIKLN